MIVICTTKLMITMVPRHLDVFGILFHIFNVINCVTISGFNYWFMLLAAGKNQAVDEQIREIT